MSGEPGARVYWDRVYRSRGPARVSWYQAFPTASLEMLDALGIGPNASLVDVGGGASTLVDELLASGWRDLSVVDASPQAVAVAAERVGDSPVNWVVEDVLHWRPARHYQVWHDRALFHFLTAEADRATYLERMRCALRPGSWVVVGTFAEDGPPQCSGLPVVRYDAESLGQALGPDLEMCVSRREEHLTPAAVVQPFTWVGMRVRGRPGDLDDYVERARHELDRVEPADLDREMADGAVVVDIRPLEQRIRDGELPGALVVDRNVLEWRMVFSSAHRLTEVDSPTRRIVVVCNQGYASSVAAVALRRLGMTRATDLAGGVQAWLAFRRTRPSGRTQ